MIKKTIMVLLATIIISSGVYAFSEGDRFSQQQVDNANFEGMTATDLNCQALGYRKIDFWTAEFVFTCLDIMYEPIGDPNRPFLLYNKRMAVMISRTQWVACRSGNDATYCRNELIRNKVLAKFGRHKESLNGWKSYSTQQEETDFRNWNPF